MQIEINENAVAQVIHVNGKIFKVTRLNKEIQWICLNCANINFDNDYIEDSFVKCRNCNKEYRIYLDIEESVTRIMPKEFYQPKDMEE